MSYVRENTNDVSQKKKTPAAWRLQKNNRFDIANLHIIIQTQTKAKPDHERAKGSSVSKRGEETTSLSQLCKSSQPTSEDGRLRYTPTRKAEVATDLFPKSSAAKTLSIGSTQPPTAECRQPMSPAGQRATLFMRRIWFQNEQSHIGGGDTTN